MVAARLSALGSLINRSTSACVSLVKAFDPSSTLNIFIKATTYGKSFNLKFYLKSNTYKEFKNRFKCSVPASTRSCYGGKLGYDAARQPIARLGFRRG